MLTRKPVVQIHASRFCNYKCLHCYSDSSPDARNSLSVDAILKTTGQLAQRGYRRASLSGGEPVLYGSFETLAKGLADQGFSTAVITNGTRPRQLLKAMEAGQILHTSISFDGPEHLHDDIRQRKGAYNRALETLRLLSDAKQSVGAVLSATRHSIPYIPGLVTDVVEAGARHIQLHPLATVGRAQNFEPILGPELPHEALLRLILMASVLGKIHPDVAVQCDALTGKTLQRICRDRRGDLITPLVIRDDGLLVPYSYDASPALALGRVGQKLSGCRVDDQLNRIIENAIRLAVCKPATTFYREFEQVSKNIRTKAA